MGGNGLFVQTGRLTPFIPAATGLALLGVPLSAAELDGADGVCARDNAVVHRTISTTEQNTRGKAFMRGILA